MIPSNSILRAADRFFTGDVVRPVAAWELTAPPAWVELTLQWRTRGRGTTDQAAAFRHRWEGGLDAAGAQAVELTMPPGPWSYDGQLVSVDWAFVLRAQGVADDFRLRVELVRPETFA